MATTKATGGARKGARQSKREFDAMVTARTTKKQKRYYTKMLGPVWLREKIDSEIGGSK